MYGAVWRLCSIGWSEVSKYTACALLNLKHCFPILFVLHLQYLPSHYISLVLSITGRKDYTAYVRVTCVVFLLLWSTVCLKPYKPLAAVGGVCPD